MKNLKNMGNIDRIIRLVVGAGLFSLLFVVNNNWKYLGILGIILLLTSAVGVCPLYMPFKITTLKKK
ncbi:MAG: DUF2892 domain-containing protein [Eubacteriales bacterium]